MYSAETVAALAPLQIGDAGRSLAGRLLVLTRPEQSTRRLAAAMSSSQVQWETADGQADLLDVGSPYQVLPDSTIDRIAEWLAGAPAAGPTAIRMPATARSAVVGKDEHGGPVLESTVRLGPIGLFGIETVAPEHARRGPTILFLSVANEHHIGPTRLWVELARRWAAVGIRSVRFDLSALGDSPAHTGQDEFVSRSIHAFDDVLAVARAVSPDDPSDVVLVGLCSSAYQAIESRARADAPRCARAESRAVVPTARDARGWSCRPTAPRLPARGRVVEAFHADNPLAAIRRRFPNAGWWLRNRAAGRRRPRGGSCASTSWASARCSCAAIARSARSARAHRLGCSPASGVRAACGSSTSRDSTTASSSPRTVTSRRRS